MNAAYALLARHAMAMLAAVALALGQGTANAQQPLRVALLIGNGSYPMSPIRTAVGDARDLAAALRELGFRTIVKENTSRADMMAALQEFGRASDGADTALFFYAGYAMQIKERNYFIPVDAAMASEIDAAMAPEDDATLFLVDASLVLERMAQAKAQFNFVILDASFDTPIREAFPAAARGLAQMRVPAKTLIAYAAAPGQIATAGTGRNGLYVSQLLQNIRNPVLSAESLFKRVRDGVERDSKLVQTPWDISTITGDFYFNASVPAAARPPGAAPSADVAAGLEREFWVSVKDSTRAEDVQAYIDQYPAGVFVVLAKNRLAALQANARPLPSPQQTAPAPSPRPPTVPIASVAPPAAPTPAPPLPTGAQTSAVGPGRSVAPPSNEIAYPDGSIYRGGIRAGKPDGVGEYVSVAYTYRGEWKDNVKQGSGIFAWANGDRYEGECARNLPNGKGKHQFSNGDTYTGDVRDGVAVGTGTYISKNGVRFEGQFERGKPNGTGVYRYPNGDRYEGGVVAGNLQGKGIYFQKDGGRIEGTFVDGLVHGKGMNYFPNGDRYEGDVQRGVLTGQGTYTYANGIKYEGRVLDGLPEGQGVLWLADGGRFEGIFENGLRKAKGVLVNPDGTRVPAEIIDRVPLPLR